MGTLAAVAFTLLLTLLFLAVDWVAARMAKVFILPPRKAYFWSSLIFGVLCFVSFKIGKINPLWMQILFLSGLLIGLLVFTEITRKSQPKKGEG